MRSILLAAAVLFGASIGGASAAIVYSSTTSVGYDPAAPSGNFSDPTNVNNGSAYDVRVGTDSSNLYVDIVAVNPPATLPAVQFANIYLGGSSFSGLIFEVTNNRVKTYDDGAPFYDLAGTGFSFVNAPGDISFVLPFSFLENDPLGIGFTKVNVGDFMRISYSQSFGYTFVGGTPLYGENRLGGFFVPAAAVPEPRSLALLGIGLAGLAVLTRRKAARLA